MSWSRRNTTVNCNGRILDFVEPRVMAILNLSPDSFSHNLGNWNLGRILDYVGNVLEEGADVIDLGGMSTRPGSEEVSVDTEWKRVGPVLEEIKKSFPDSIISIDTYRSEIAEKALDSGADIINDISGGLFDPNLIELVAERKIPYILMHNRGKSKVMQQLTDYENLVQNVHQYLLDRIYLLSSKGINDVIVDPGFGFAKTIEQNFQLMKHLRTFTTLSRPLMIGVSRKAMFYKTVGIAPEESVSLTTAFHFKALEQGANMLRVHDVKEAVQCIELFKVYNEA